MLKYMTSSVEDYLKNIIRQPELLTTVQLNAKKAGLDKMTDREIEAEIANYRKAKTFPNG